MLLWLPESSVFRQAQDGGSSRGSTAQALFGEGRGRTTLALWLSYFFTLTVMYMLLNWLPSLLLEQGFSKPQAGLVQMLFNIGGALGSLLGGLLLDRCNGIKVVLFVYAGLLSALAGVGLSVGIVPMAIAGFAAGLFVMAAQLVLYALAPPSYPTTVRATGGWCGGGHRTPGVGGRASGCRADPGGRGWDHGRIAGDFAWVGGCDVGCS
nr:hypothetical protein GCM10020185_71810 [Pseudomonas brassicacearum subsp. brassicacearum]